MIGTVFIYIYNQCDMNLLIDTPRNLRAVVRSLLQKPFDFSLYDSLSKLDSGNFLEKRSDKEQLLDIANFYDQIKVNLSSQLPLLIYELQNKYKFKVTDLSHAREIVRYNVDTQRCGDFGFDPEQAMETNVVSRQLDRLYDHLSLTRSGNEPPLTGGFLCRVIKFFIFNELLALTLAGKLKVSKLEKTYVFQVRDLEQRQIIDRHLFAKSMAIESSKADMYLVRLISEWNLELNRKHIDLVGELILNKELFIKKQHLTKESYEIKSTIFIVNVANLIGALLLAKVRQTNINLNRYELSMIGLDYDFVKGFVLEHKSRLITEQFIACNNNEIELSVESWASNLPALLKDKVEELGELDKVREHLGGKFFEVGYIFNELNESPDYSGRFIVKKGFDRDQVVGSYKNKADVDIILYDKKIKHYYFLQVKFSIEGNTPYFSGAVKRLQQDLSKGIEQLSEAKRLLESDRLGETVKNLGFNDTPSLNNSSFIVLHNLPDYDYQVTNYGIALYDWNSFRNLILDFRILSPSEEGLFEYRGDYIAKLSDPDIVISKFFSHHPVFKGQKDNVLLAKTSKLNVVLDNCNIVAIGIGI